MLAGEKVIIVHADGLPEMMRMERIVTMRMRRDPDGCAIVGHVVGLATPLVIADKLCEGEARRMFDALQYWLTGRGGPVFDVLAWRKEHRALTSPVRTKRRTA